jgi:hypothetical protein
MRRSFAIAAVLAVMLGFAAPAHAKTDRQKFQSLVAKVTQKFGSSARRVCICFESEKYLRAGYLAQKLVNDQVNVECDVPEFDQAGGFIDAEPRSDFLPIGK